MPPIPLIPLVIGVIVSLALNTITGSLLSHLFAGTQMVVEARSVAESAVPQLTTTIVTDNGFLIWSMILGALSSFVGCYVMLFLAGGRNYLFHSLIFATLSVLVGLVTQFSHPAPLPVWYSIASYILLFTVSILAGIIESARTS